MHVYMLIKLLPYYPYGLLQEKILVMYCIVLLVAVQQEISNVFIVIACFIAKWMM